MTNHQISSQYTFVPDSTSLEGLDDFLCGLIDELFQVDAEGTPDTISNRAELALIEQDIFDEIASDTTDDRSNVVSALPGLFARSVAATKTMEERPSIFEGDTETNTLELKTKLLESQLDYRNKELQESLRRMQWLENELAAREDQIKFLPELLKRSIDATRYELELDDLKLKLEFLSSELTEANSQLSIIRSNWLGRLSLWLTAKREEMQRSYPPIGESSV
ncbi:MAG: hypothetical protein SGJ27_01220 [Candidatus Melainabacteria bacterium]|nr:hypothetical protein [Candidatus Melainabacteria bacterium]